MILKNQSGLADTRGDERTLPHFPVSAGPVTLNASSSASPFHGSEASQASRPNSSPGRGGSDAPGLGLKGGGGLFDVSSGPLCLLLLSLLQADAHVHPHHPVRRPCCWPPSYFSWASPAPPPKEPHLPGPVQAAASLGSLSPALHILVLPVPEPLTACTESASVPSRRTPAWPSLLGSSPSHPVCESGGQDRALGKKAG